LGDYAKRLYEISTMFLKAQAEAKVSNSPFNAKQYFIDLQTTTPLESYKKIIPFLIKEAEHAENNNYELDENVFDTLKLSLEQELGIQDLFGFSAAQYRAYQKSGVIYDPSSERSHTWMLNFSWLLGHLHKGHRFYIVSGIPENEFRRSEGEEHKRSAFALELCTAHKAGYDLIYDDTKRQLCLIAPNTFDPGKCGSSGERGNGINPSDIEAQEIFEDFKQKVEKLKAVTETETTLIKYSEYGTFGGFKFRA
jgi:hypothetical protein